MKLNLPKYYDILPYQQDISDKMKNLKDGNKLILLPRCSGNPEYHKLREKLWMKLNEQRKMGKTQ